MRIGLASFDRVPSAKGASQHILANADILRAQHDVSLVTLGDKPIAGLRHLPLAIAERNWLTRALRFREAVERVFERERFDVHHVRSPWEGLAAPASSRVVYEVNALYSIEMADHHPGLIERPNARAKMRTLELALMDRSDLVVTTNPVTRDYLLDVGVQAQQIRLVPNRPSFEAREHIEHEGPVRLAYIGTLTRWQGLHSLLKSLGDLRDLDWVLTIRTPTRKTKWVSKWVRKLELDDRVVLLPPLPAAELGHWLATQDIGLAPLTPCERNLIQGCMPIKVLDYVSAGCAVLAPDMPVVRHVLGEDVLLYRRYSRDSMVEVLGGLIRDEGERQRAARDGLAWVGPRYSAQTQRDALLAAYAELDA